MSRASDRLPCLETEVPGLDHGVAARFSPGIEDLHQPAFDFRGIYADVAGGVVDFRAVLGRFSGRPGDHAAIRAVGFVVAIDGLPQRNKSKKNSLAAGSIGSFMQQVEGGNPVNLAALKVESVTNFDETGDQGRFEGRICNVFAGSILAFGRRAEEGSATGEGLHLLPHGGDGLGVSSGESGAWQPL